MALVLLACIVSATIWLATRDRTPPVLKLSEPDEGTRLFGASVLTVRGTATDAGGPVVVTAAVDAREARATARPDGSFELTLTFAPGTASQLKLEVSARDAAGNESLLERGLRSVQVPSWYSALPDTRRPPLPLPEGISFGDAAGDYENAQDGTLLRWIPPGSFLMGSASMDLQAFANEHPQRRVSFARGFYLGKFETTWAQVHAFCQATGRVSPTHRFDVTALGGGVHEASAAEPAFYVTWDEAVTYCEWAGLRLPSEAEWEYAARGEDGRRFPWGNAKPGVSRLNLADCGSPWTWPPEAMKPYRMVKAPFDDGFPYTAPVGSYPDGASPHGCLDMAGNVLEWVQDGYVRSYRDAPTDGSAREPTGATERVSRGGNWCMSARLCRATYRNGYAPGFRAPFMGFRPARSR